MAWARLRVAGNNPVICGRKLCSGCGCWRHLMDFPSRRREPLEILSRCYACARVTARNRLVDPATRERKRAFHRDYQRRRRRRMGQRTREQFLEENRGVILGRKHCTRCKCWRPVSDYMLHPEGRLTGRCRACLRISARERYAKDAQDPVKLELRREYQRIWGEAQRRARGIPERQWVHGRQVEAVNARWTMDASTLRAQVRVWLIEHHASEEQLADSAGVSDRLIRRLLHEDARVSVWAADRLALTMGLHLELVA
jgi:hypothetical protein